MAHKYPGLIFAVLSYIFGGSSLLVFAIFLWAGDFNLINFRWDESTALIFNAALSITFFLQHSIMVRPLFKQQLSRLIPDTYHGAFYSIFSGTLLLMVIAFWQSTSVLWQAEGLMHLFMRMFFILSIFGFFWTVKSLVFFDPFGIKEIREHMRKAKALPVKFTVKGPYRWVRHPVYFFVLIMIWSCPALSADRLLFNIMWSVWIIIGAALEEKDLTSQFGDTYREYQKFVPMLLPYKGIFTGQKNINFK